MNHIMKHKFGYYSYTPEMEEALQIELDNRLSLLEETAKQAVFLD